MALSKIIENSISDGVVSSAKLKDFAAAVDLNGVELILDADQDTSITADTDDRIDFKIAGVEHISLSNSSGDTVIKPMVDAKDIIFQQYDGNKVFEINDANFVSVGGNATAPGEIRLYEDTDLGSHYVGFKAGNNTASVSYVLPLADGTNGQSLTTNSSGTLSWSTISANTPTSADGQALGSAALEWSDLYLADSGVIYFGADQDITLTHNHNAGLTLNGVLVATGITIGSAAITEAELEILDGANVTTAELNIMDGGTSATSTTVADADRVVMNDNGTMVQVAVTDLAAYFDDEITAMPNLVTVSALNSGSITSGFGTINTGSSTITTTGAITGGSLIADDVTVDGKVITMTGSSGDTATFTASTHGSLAIATTDASAAAANITITADGTSELAGTTVTLNSSGGVTLDADGGTITFADGGSSLGTITSSGYSGTAAVATTVTVTDNEDTNENNAITFVAGADSDGGNVGLESDGNLTYNPSTGTLSATNIVVSGTQTITNSVTMNASNAVVFEGATADAHETTLTSIDATGDRTISLPNVSGTLPVLAAASATAITATPAELNYVDGVTSAIQTQLNAITANNWVTNARLADDAVDTAEIADSAVETAQINNNAVTTAKTYFISTSSVPGVTSYGDGNMQDGYIQLNCSQNSHGIKLKGPPHSAGADYTLTFPNNDGSANEMLLTNGSGVLSWSTVGTNTLAADAVTGAKIADDAINSEHYTDGSIDTAHIADLNVTGAKLALDHRSAGNADDVKTGNQQDYIFFDGDVGISFFTANAEDMRLEDDGDLHVDGDVVAFSTTISDERLKENIQPIEDALSKVSQLNGVTFSYKADGKESAGLIAQDVEKVLPSAITEKELPLKIDDGNEYKVLQYDQTIGLLVEAIKELKAEIDELKGE